MNNSIAKNRAAHMQNVMINDMMPGALEAAFFSPRTVNVIQATLMSQLEPRVKQRVHVADHVIINVMDQIWESHRPLDLGDMFSRYHLSASGREPEPEPEPELKQLVCKVMDVIFQEISAEFGIAANNNRASVWRSMNGDDIDPTTRRYTIPVKLNEKRAQSLAFNMRY